MHGGLYEKAQKFFNEDYNLTSERLNNGLGTTEGAQLRKNRGTARENVKPKTESPNSGSR